MRTKNTPKSYRVTGCQEDLSVMPKVDGGLYCGTCRHKVHDLTRATKAEADALMKQHGGDVCIMIRAGADGRAKFRPEPKKMSGFVLLSALTASACASDSVAQGTQQNQQVQSQATQQSHSPLPPNAPMNAREYAAQAEAKRREVEAALAQNPPPIEHDHILAGAPLPD